VPSVLGLKKAISFGAFYSPKFLAIAIKTLIVPVIEYTFPFWEPSTAHAAKLNSLILSILRFGCSIGAHVTNQAIFHEFDLLPVHLLFIQSLLRYHLRLNSGVGGIKVQAYYRESLDLHSYRGVRQRDFTRFGNYVSSTLHTNSLSLPSLCEMNGVAVALNKLLSSWFHQVGDPTLIPRESSAAAKKRLKSEAKWLYRFKRLSLYPQYNVYFCVDRKVAIFRMQLRLKCARINSYLFKIGSSISYDCPYCPSSCEDIDHLLLHCPIYSVPRATLCSGFATIHLPVTVNSILLSNLIIPPVFLETAITISSSFLSSIHRLRF
jgi:hypothetical protein